MNLVVTFTLKSGKEMHTIQPHVLVSQIPRVVDDLRASFGGIRRILLSGYDADGDFSLIDMTEVAAISIGAMDEEGQARDLSDLTNGAL